MEINKLSILVVCKISYFLSIKELIYCSRVSKSWNFMFTKERLWKILFSHYFPNSRYLHKENSNWMRLFKEYCKKALFKK